MYKVTVGICCYKQKDWLYRSLRSLASQTMSKEEYEVVVVNDDPEQKLDDVCDMMREHLNIKLINNEKNIGLPASLNKILKKSLGRYFVRVDCDDYVSKHFLHTLALFLDMNREVQASFCDYLKVNAVGNTIGRCDAKKEPIACGIMMTYESLCNINFYNEEYRMREGHELMSRFNERYKSHHVKLPLYRYRIHESNRTHNKDEVKKYDQKLGVQNGKTK